MLEAQQPRRTDLEAPKEHILEGKELSDVFFWSFYFSQGLLDVQKMFFRHMFELHKDWKLPGNFDVETFVGQESPRFERFLSSASHSKLKTTTSMPTLKDRVTNEVKTVAELLKEAALEPRVNVKTMLEYMLIKEATYYSKTGERPAQDSARADSGPFSKQKSHVISFVLLGEKTPGPPIFQDGACPQGPVDSLAQVTEEEQGWLGSAFMTPRSGMGARVSTSRSRSRTSSGLR